ncbi:helix-turn-helix domain-containing protein [Amphibacillus jilinensis]|uniref:helix-turn-helix domain-containing protein n=1 Tax=Amphibacillus jilinensis TaxID=1216008 RepID=UPI00030768D5|nr:helix-turn-helix domain-containing protein [Amphibacillus jilinensis]
MFTFIILFCVERLKCQRSIASIYHILQGKRAAQTIQDANLYQLTGFFSIYSKLRRSQFDQVTNQLLQSGWIAFDRNNYVYVTEVGKQFLINHQGHFQIEYFDGVRYAKIVDVFIKRFSLTVQTYSNVVMDRRTFMTIVDDDAEKQWVKRHYQMAQNDLESFLVDLHESTKAFLKSIDHSSAQLFVDRLTGYQQVGLSVQQLARKNNASEHDIKMMLTLTYHRFLQYIEDRRPPILLSFVNDQLSLVNQHFMTNSARKTYQLMCKGLTIDDVVTVRQLKRSTIEDHVVEMAYALPELNIETYISDTEFNKIAKAIQLNDNRKLSLIKAYLNDEFNYFQIRLVMARYQIKVN